MRDSPSEAELQPLVDNCDEPELEVHLPVLESWEEVLEDLEKGMTD